jgi:hypothetical protein
MDVDPIASMRIWAIEIQLGGRTFDVPALPAADWFPVLMAGDPSQILDLLRSDPLDSENLDELLLTGAVAGADLGQALVDAIEEVAGRSFHAAFVLASVAAANWPSINGRLAERGFRWDLMPLGAALDAIYSIVTNGLDKDPREKFLRLLDNETLTGGRPRAHNREKVTAEFETIAGPKPTGGLRASGAPSDSARPKTRPRPQPRPQDAP